MSKNKTEVTNVRIFFLLSTFGNFGPFGDAFPLLHNPDFLLVRSFSNQLLLTIYFLNYGQRFIFKAISLKFKPKNIPPGSKMSVFLLVWK